MPFLFVLGISLGIEHGGSEEQPFQDLAKA